MAVIQRQKMKAAVKPKEESGSTESVFTNVEKEDRAKVVECSMKHIQMSLCQFIV